MSADNTKSIDIRPEKGQISGSSAPSEVASPDVPSSAGSTTTSKGRQARVSSSSERQIKFERAQKCLENAALVTKRIKEHRKATAELLGRPFEDDDGGDTASEMASTMSERTSYSVGTDTSTTLSVQEALNIPGISESLANTLKQKELLMERIKQYKEISKRPLAKRETISYVKREASTESSAELGKAGGVTELNQAQKLIQDKENVISVLQVKMKAMETTIMDLQEKISEKDMIIEAKTKAATLMSDNLKKERDSLALLEDTRQQMLKMQENFVAMESEWKDEKSRLLNELRERDDKIKNLEEANSILEATRFDMSVTYSKVIEKLEEKNREISELEENITKLSKSSESLMQKDTEPQEKSQEEKGSLEIATMVDLTKRLEILEQLNCQMRQTNKELENKLALLNTDNKPSGSSPKKSPSPLATRKSSRGMAAKVKSPWTNISETSSQEPDKKPNKNDVTNLEMIIQSLNKEIIDKEYLITQKDECLSKFQTLLSDKEQIIDTLENKISENEILIHNLKTFTVVPSNIENEPEIRQVPLQSENTKATPEGTTTVFEWATKLEAAQRQILTLTEEINAANKNMIKVKSNHKTKLKQLQKTIDNFSKMSDGNAEITRLNEEVHQLTQKVAELEEEKGNLQLHLVDYDSGRLTESETYRKLVEVETLAESRLNAISVLETQKFDLVQELHELQQKYVDMEDKLADMSHLQNEHVCTEIQSVQLEEQLDELLANKKEMSLIIENLKLDIEQLEESLRGLEKEKDELSQRLDHYIQENIELTDKIEKLSAEKVSSAESIEIVESLTTQEKLELEEYNKGVTTEEIQQSHHEDFKLSQEELNESLQKLTEESAELNKKIELFTLERKEVMEKMNAINFENESLQNQTMNLTTEVSKLRVDIEMLRNEKEELMVLNVDLTNQIEELKRERVDIMKETATLSKPATSVDETGDPVAPDLQEDRSSVEKSGKGTKTVKQLTKDILKLKNIIKEREDEIADCQMKILSLEEQQQKQNELLQNNSLYEAKLKTSNDEKKQLIEEIEALKSNEATQISLSEEFIDIKNTNEQLQLELLKIQKEFNETVVIRDSRIQELENLLSDYESQIYNYSNTLQVKDKQLAEYINQITKLNDVSQKLKSTIECLEEEKAKDQNADLVKSLNKQILVYQKTLTEYEEKLKHLDDEKSKLVSLKSVLESKNMKLENELKILQDSILEKQRSMQELQQQHQKFSDDINSITLQVKERDEEIHEIKLQLRKESIENEKLRTEILENEQLLEAERLKVEESNTKLSQILSEKSGSSEQVTELETKNKELLEKLKKFAITLKKKNTMYTEVEQQNQKLQSELDNKVHELNAASTKLVVIPGLYTTIGTLEEELKRLKLQLSNIEKEKYNEIFQLQARNKELEDSVMQHSNEKDNLTKLANKLNYDLNKCREENTELTNQIELLNKSLVEYEIEQKNNVNSVTKITNLEADLLLKQAYITDLLSKIDNMVDDHNNIICGMDAKMQERDLYIESLELETSKYSNRIGRLEESISIMEDRRHSLERKADQLDIQLQEKHKAYSEYATQEDELINRLAVLMDHDRVVEKRLHEIEKDNKELQIKIQNVNEENVRLRVIISEVQNQCESLTEKANKAEFMESQLSAYVEKNQELENRIKKVTSEHQNVILMRKQDIEELESEFNTQIENAIKEKKVVSEKYEKVNDRVAFLEQKLNEYKISINNLNENLEQMSRVNLELSEKNKDKENASLRDYTEQYINEINKLNAVINSKNEDIAQLGEAIRQMQFNSNHLILTKEQDLEELNNKLVNSTEELNSVLEELKSTKHTIDSLTQDNFEKDEKIRQLTEMKTMTFAMNIPKTEGLLISSKIEELTAEPSPTSVDMISLESQIVTDDASNNDAMYAQAFKEREKSENDTTQIDSSADVNTQCVEEPIIAKHAYLCYKDSDHLEENLQNKDVSDIKDPFNSEEGWGFDDSGIDPNDLLINISRLNEQVLRLKKDNEKVQSELDLCNLKYNKALKKLKDLKNNNEILSKELKLSKQLSQPEFLDSTIEDELRSQVQELDKTMEELQTKLLSERREKESLRKQIEVLGAANDRLTEIKEKLDNEIELWKFKFIETNDKFSSLQWGSDVKEEQANNSRSRVENKEEIIKLEKENDELQHQVEQVTKENNELSISLSRLAEELNSLKDRHDVDVICSNCNSLQQRILQLETQIQDANTVKESTLLKLHVQGKELDVNIQNFNENISYYESKLSESHIIISSLQADLNDANNKISSLTSQLQDSNNKLNEQLQYDNISIENQSTKETCDALNKEIQSFKEELERNQASMIPLINENGELKNQVMVYKKEIEDLSQKLLNLNTENDQLLSTVAELRSSMSSAVDQRGYEIAEMWKQHLAQREADFGKFEQDLREQLNLAERKYEQLLDNMQSSSQEETNTLVMVEQVNGLQAKLKDKEEHLMTLQNKYGELLNEIEMLRSEMEDEKIMHDNKLLAQQDEYEKHISEITIREKRSIEAHNNEILKLQTDLQTSKEELLRKSNEIEDISNKYINLESKLADVVGQLCAKDSEIYQKTNDLTVSLTQRNDEFESVRQQLVEYEKKLDDLSYEKESELAVLRLKMHENFTSYENKVKEYENEKSNLIESLNSKVIDCVNLNKQLTEVNQTIQDNSVKMTEMQAALENQEIEIVTLKDEIANLQDMLKASSSKIEKHVTFASDTKPPDESPTEGASLHKDLLDPVPKAELDLALYMLHQRDVRCEELTMELTQLLDERDTLQLRLSDSIRSMEDFKLKCKLAGFDVMSGSSQETLPESPAGISSDKDQPFVDVHKGQTSRSSSVSEPDTDKPKLQAKLSELRSVRHSRDVRLRNESEQREMTMRLLQRDVANLPPEAAEQLRQAHHTLSRDTQSTSTVLLNWLRGKSTPKVVHM